MNNFNPTSPTVMHVDLNSCFATIEQQANPLLRGKPIAVVSYTTDNGCVLAASREAKAMGVKTAMRIREARFFCPSLRVLSPDPAKYRYVNRKLLMLLGTYSDSVAVKSIDEMVLDVKYAPSFSPSNILSLGQEIKKRIRDEIGEWLTVSIGISTNRYLSKIASGLHKPDGLDIIDRNNCEKIFFTLALEGLTGIKKGNGSRLRCLGITTALEYFLAPKERLIAAFSSSVLGHEWWMRMHGYEVDDREFETKSYGHSYALYVPYAPKDNKLQQILYQLTDKMARRLRKSGSKASGVHISTVFSDFSSWHHGEKIERVLLSAQDFFVEAKRILLQSPDKPVRTLAVSCYGCKKDAHVQTELFSDRMKTERITKAVDTLLDRWGDGVISSGRTLGMETKILDRIAFGAVQGLDPFEHIESITHSAV